MSSGCVRKTIIMLCFKFHQDPKSGTSSKTPPSSISMLESWRIGWSLDVIWMCQEDHNHAVVQISSRSKVRNIIKDTPVLHLHAGVLEDRLGSGYLLDISELS